MDENADDNSALGEGDDENADNEEVTLNGIDENAYIIIMLYTRYGWKCRR